MATLSTHVLDTSRGLPAVGVRVWLESESGTPIAEGVTDHDGRIGGLGDELTTGPHRLRFATADHSEFYPEVAITFVVGDAPHYHVPLLLSPFGYSTYRGS